MLYEGQRPVALRVTRSRRVAFLRIRRKNAECINRGVRSPGRCPGLWATLGLCIMSAALGIARTSSALRSLARHFSPPQSFTGRLCKLVALIAEPQPILCKGKENKAMCRVFTLPAMFFVGRIRQSFPLWAQRLLRDLTRN